MVLDRRHFLQLPTASLFMTARSRTARGARQATVTESLHAVHARGKNYTWEWSQSEDLFRLLDTRGRMVTTGPMQPAVIVSSPTSRLKHCSPGRFGSKSMSGNRLAVTYDGINGTGTITVAWRFDEDGLWFEP